MFFKKKQIQEAPKLDYTKWNDDLGFLNFISTRKKNITKEYLISVYQKQKSDKDYLTDEEIEPIVNDIVNEIISQISDSYKSFLIEKYFGSIESLIKFISEDVYVDLTSDAINRNIKKITATVQKNALSALSGMNKKQ